MGKSVFKMRLGRLDVGSVKGVIEMPRAEVVSVIEEFSQGQRAQVRIELHNLAASVEYLGFGGWYLNVPEEFRSLLAGQPEVCGCPLASISDWVEPDEPLEGINIRNLSEGDMFFNRWDNYCRSRAGFTVGAVRVID